MCKLHFAITERLIVRQRMCKILVFACSVPGYDLNQERAMINWKQEDWEELMKNLAQLLETSKPFRNKTLKELYFSCTANMLLATIRQTLEDDIKHKGERETVSLSAEEQKKFQYVSIIALKLFNSYNSTPYTEITLDISLMAFLMDHLKNLAS